MEAVDLLFLVVILLSAWGGWRSGFVYTAIGLATWVGSLVAAFCLYPYLVRPLARTAPGLGVWTLPVAFLLVLLMARVALWLLFSKLLNLLPDEIHFNPLNKLMGIVPGVINGLVAASVVALLLMALPFSDRLSEQMRRSRFADELTMPAEWVEERLSPVFERPVEQTIGRLAIEPHSDETVKLPYTTRRLQTRPGRKNVDPRQRREGAAGHRSISGGHGIAGGCKRAFRGYVRKRIFFALYSRREGSL